MEVKPPVQVCYSPVQSFSFTEALDLLQWTVLHTTCAAVAKSLQKLSELKKYLHILLVQ